VTAVTSAVAAVARAEEKLAEATTALDEAADALDRALAAEGWHRLSGAFTPGTRLYTSAINPAASVDRAQLVAEFERLAAAR
jgi:hypothetical protein